MNWELGFVAIVSGAAFGLALSAWLNARRTERRSAELAKDALAKSFANQQTREERIAQARGWIAAAAGAELALGHHTNDCAAAMALAQYRAHAAHARQTLVVLGVQS